MPPSRPTAPHRFGLKRGSFSFKRHGQWTYEDRVGDVNNSIPVATSHNPHLVLYDVHDVPRVTLSYYADRQGIVVWAVQRERTQYSQGERRPYWDASKEKEASDAFKYELGGVHPSEFLLSEFVWRFRRQIQRGRKVYLKAPFGDNEKKLYGPLVSRFFTRDEVRLNLPIGGVRVHELNLNRERVKRLLKL